MLSDFEQKPKDESDYVQFRFRFGWKIANRMRLQAG